MSSPGPSGAGPKKTKIKKKVVKKKKDEESTKKDGSATDETASNSDRRDDGNAPKDGNPPRTLSAGASMRDAANRVLTLALKNEWTAAEGVIKSLEKSVDKAKKEAEEEVIISPMAGVQDPVRLFF